MLKYLNPRRYYYAWGRKKFVGFIVFAIFLLFFYTPLMNLIMLAFADVYQAPAVIPQAFGLNWWKFVLSQRTFLQAVATSLLVAGLTTLVSLVICLPAAYAIARFRFPGKKIFLLILLLSNAFPRIGLYTTMGILFYQYHLIGTIQGVVIIHVINSLVFMIWLPSGAFQSIHREQEEAARDVGAGKFRTFMKITLPLAWPGIMVACLYTFLGSIEEAQGTLLVGFPQVKTLATQMYGVILDYPGTAGAVFSFILIIPTVVLLLVFRKKLKLDSLSGISVK